MLLVGTVVVVVTAYIRARKTVKPIGVVRAKPALPGKVTTVIEGYKYVRTDEKGRETLRLFAARDTAYEDGRHELEKIDLTAFSEDGKNARITAERGEYQLEGGEMTFMGNVKIASSEGLEVASESMKYFQKEQIATTEVAVQFRKGEIAGSSIGAEVNARAHTLALRRDARLVSALPADPKSRKPVPPVEIRSDRATYAELDGVVRFEGNAQTVQGERTARADGMTGVIDLQTKKLTRVEMRGNSFLQSLEKGKASEVRARDMDFHFDEEQRLKAASADGGVRALSLEKDAPREILAERMLAEYRPTEKGSELQTVTTQGRTTMRLEVAEGAPNARTVTERVLEADGVQASFREDGKNLARAEAGGNAMLTVTPRAVTPKSEIRRLRAARFTVDFFPTGNAIRTFLADGNAVADFEPMAPAPKGSAAPRKKTISGKKMTAQFAEPTQEIADLTVEGDAKLVEGDRNATAARAVYAGATQIVALRGKPQLWDLNSRANAEEIDANLDTGESDLRGRVRTTWFSRETTGGAAPFKKNKAPVTIASDQARVRHNEGAARYVGNVRAWQDSDFIRADNLELDKGERTMTAWGGAQSAFYEFEREVEKNRRETVPVFTTSDRIVYTDANRTAHYEGDVKIRQGTDRIDAAAADVLLDENNRLVSLTADRNVVLTQPGRRAAGDRVVYTAANDTAILTGNPAELQEQERAATSKSPKLTLHLRDARIEANDISDASEGASDGKSNAKRRVRTTHRIRN